MGASARYFAEQREDERNEDFIYRSVGTSSGLDKVQAQITDGYTTAAERIETARINEIARKAQTWDVHCIQCGNLKVLGKFPDFDTAYFFRWAITKSSGKQYKTEHIAIIAPNKQN
jgi:hypothetical protein